jgi:hypothetical protein
MPLLICRVCGYQARNWLDYAMHKAAHPTHQ